MARRFDALVRIGGVQATSDGQLWKLLIEIARRSTLEKNRVVDRLQRADTADAELARHLTDRLSKNEGDGLDGTCIDTILRSMCDDTNREILVLWLHECSLASIASTLEIPEGTVRRRWMVIRAELCKRFESLGQK